MTTVSATELQNNFGKYLQYVQTGNDVIILRNGKEVARLISYDKSVSFLTDSLLGVLKGDYSEESIKAEKMRKYESIDVLCNRKEFVKDSEKVLKYLKYIDTEVFGK